MKKCTTCKEQKLKDDFYIIKGKVMHRCKECQKKYVRKWKQLHKQMVQVGAEA